MQVQKIQNNNYNPVFSATIVETGAFRRFKAHLGKSDIKAFDSYINIIEGSADNSNYVFNYLDVGSFKNVRKFAIISKQNKDRTVQHPPLLVEKAGKALQLFKNLADMCSNKSAK